MFLCLWSLINFSCVQHSDCCKKVRFLRNGKLVPLNSWVFLLLLFWHNVLRIIEYLYVYLAQHNVGSNKCWLTS